MAHPQAQSPSHLYSQELQLKLYQAFIFSIPILFSIILFLLFYLFYLKRRASSVSISSPSIIPRSLINQATPIAPSSEIGWKGNFKDKLPVILFDEDLRTRDSQCCVCLGEFEIKEELHQVPSCKHVFHVDCIRHWLRSNSTCPLCRCSVNTTTINSHPKPPNGPSLIRQDNENLNQDPQIVSPEQQEQLASVSVNMANYSREHVVLMEGSSSGTTSICMENETGCQNGESVVLTIQTHNT
ncbi:probable E3 ubiquitin-protein ligase RHA4A [Cornus florida]|uniref:probable E3 ubiquitin-protein ligase RHA4A n=1 Tax=Cornus florida TaxID=4283 RepID=UPI00289F120B|nr:probable E3 ubiquitin-protein ligase RHA4A [Cornus florida]